MSVIFDPEYRPSTGQVANRAVRHHSKVPAQSASLAVNSDVADDDARQLDDDLLYAEDLAIGDAWTTEYRCVSGQDVHTFADLTGDHTPLHGSKAAPSPFGKPIVHGLLGLSVLAGLGTTSPNAYTLALIGIEDWQFLAPVYFGDRVKARNEIVELEPHGRRAVKVRWLRQLINETGRVVQQGHFVTLVGSQSRAGEKPR